MGGKHRRKSHGRRLLPSSDKAVETSQETGQHESTPISTPAEVKVEIEVDARADTEIVIASSSSALTTQVNEQVADKNAPTPLPDPSVMKPEQAHQVVEVFFVQLLAANVSPLSLLLARSDCDLDADQFVQLLVAHIGTLELHPSLFAALNSSAFHRAPRSLDINKLIEMARAINFRIELLEFQIRQALLGKALVRTRSAVDIQRAVSRLAASVPDGTPVISASDLDAMFEQKLGLSVGSSVMARVLFSRITLQPFSHRLPKRLAIPKAEFFAALEAFVGNKPLAMESVEGQLRYLLSKHHDLRASFQSLDKDKSGAISVEEFIAFLEQEAHMCYPREIMAAFVQRFDTDGDGTLSYEEFIAFASPKQFGIQVLTPFGLFYHATDRCEPMEEVMGKIKTRMFWMQHNDLFSISTHPIPKAPFKLKVTDHFTLASHYGTIRLHYNASDPISKVLENGELVVLLLDQDLAASEVGSTLPSFEYRLRPKTKRSIPPLMSMVLQEEKTVDTASDAVKIAHGTQNPSRVMAGRSERKSTLSPQTVKDIATVSSSSRRSHSVSRRRTQQAIRTMLPSSEGESSTIVNRTMSSASVETPRVTPQPTSNSIDPEPSLSESTSSHEYFDDAEDVAGDESAPPLRTNDLTVGGDEDEPPPYT